MRINEIKKSKTISNRVGKFRVEGDKIFLTRMGPVNPQKQTHSNDPGAMHVPPAGINRGMWAFPWPYFDEFFTSHIVRKRMPKRHRKNEPYPGDLNDKEAYKAWSDKQAQDFADFDDQYKEKRKSMKRSTFWWSGPLFSRVGPETKYHSNGWYYWNSPIEWAEYAKNMGTEPKLQRIHGFEKPQLFKTSGDHLELFLPVTAKSKLSA